MKTTFNRAKVGQSVVEACIGRLAVLKPVYVQGDGDCTEVLLADGTSWLEPRPVPVVLQQVARYFGVDLTAVRDRYGEILGKRLHVPLPLSPHLVLVPLKMRVPRVQKDGTTGYIVKQLVERVGFGASTTVCRVEMRGIGPIDCLQSREFAEQQLRNARIVQTFYQERMKISQA